MELKRDIGAIAWECLYRCGKASPAAMCGLLTLGAICQNSGNSSSWLVAAQFAASLLSSDRGAGQKS